MTNVQDTTTAAATATTTAATTTAAATKTDANAASPQASSSSSPSTNTTNYALVASYIVMVALWAASPVVLIPYVPHLLLLVTSLLYAACHGSLALLHDDEPVLHTDAHGNTTVLPPAEREILRKADALQFPLIGSATLLALYLAFRFLDKDLVNLLIGGYLVSWAALP